jgi:hypothetical protein
VASIRATNAIDKAAAAFKKEERIREGEKAMAEYLAARVAEEKKIERLRSLRLAYEAARQSDPARKLSARRKKR